MRITLLFVMAFVPSAAAAQSGWDIAATAGLFSGYTPRTGGSTFGYQETWFESAQGGVTVGRHVTPHVKVELDVSTTSGGTQLRERLVNVPGYAYPYPIASEVTTAVRSIAPSVVWQFRNNEWVHPFVHAGVSTDFDRMTVRTWEQIFYRDPRSGADPVRLAAESRDGPTTERRIRAVLGGGAKVYVLERAFVRTEGRWSFDRQRHNLAFRIGFGVDL